MKNRQYSQDATLVSRRVRGGKSKLFSLPGCLGGLVLCIVLVAAAFGGYSYLAPGGRSGPLVLIHAPHNGEHLIVGQPATVQAVASDERKIVRVELWVDGQLLDSETSNVSGGISSFPLLADWQPASAGAHTILVRAFNSLGVRAHSSINVNVTADRDGDGVTDDTDLCPDQSGLDVSNGCPDRDIDGVPDSSDACPDVAGSPEAGGCAAVVEGDRDGDGAPDAQDMCPDTSGSPLLEGCPDSDGDLVADIEDPCAGEAGSAGGGCPAPAGDADGDGVPDGSDVCSSEWGLAEHGGCPEVLPGSDDGFVPGSGTTDSDGDGASDDADPCPTEAGLPENGYCPPPTGDPGPPEEEGGFEIPLYFFDTAHLQVFVEFEALHFEVSRRYRDVWCYVQLAGGDVQRYDFDPGAERQWEIAEVLGEENSVHLALTQDNPVDVFAECYGRAPFIARHYYLGSITGQHPSQEWDGHVIELTSSGGDAEHSFQVRYHLCSSSCEANAFQPPVITDSSTDRDRIKLAWEWEGDWHSIDGFRLYLNGNFVGVYDSRQREMTWLLRGYCVDRWEFYMTTFGGPDPQHPDLESPPGNTVVVEDVDCQKRVRVTFATLNLHDPAADDAGRRDPGPLTGTFSVTAGPYMEFVSFHAVHCLPFIFPPFERCWGYRLNEGEHSIQSIFDGARAAHEACGDRRICHGRHYGASPSDTVLIGVNPGDDLTIAARITDADEGNPDDLLFHEQAVVDTSDLSSDSLYTLVIPGEQVDLKVLIDLFPFDP